MNATARRASASKAAVPPASGSPMSSVAKALLVLECVGLSGCRTLTDIAREVHLPKSTLLRLIQALIARGFLRRTAHGEYAVSLKIWRMGCSALDSGAIHDEVLPLLHALVEKTGETAHYAAYEDGSSVYLEKVDGLHPIRSYTAVGGRSPAYATATGKALLAWRDEDEIADIGRRAQRFTDATTCGADDVLAEAARTRRLGYAVNRGEWRASVWGIAAPIFNRHRRVIAAIGISGPRERVEPNVDAFSTAVCKAAQQLSEALAPLDPASALKPREA
jgi:DNA-binding IclR family transcriptional regulator